MKKFFVIAAALLAFCFIFSFGCNKPEKEKQPSNIVQEHNRPSDDEDKPRLVFPREPHFPKKPKKWRDRLPAPNPTPILPR